MIESVMIIIEEVLEMREELSLRGGKIVNGMKKVEKNMVKMDEKSKSSKIIGGRSIEYRYIIRKGNMWKVGRFGNRKVLVMNEKKWKRGIKGRIIIVRIEERESKSIRKRGMKS